MTNLTGQKLYKKTGKPKKNKKHLNWIRQMPCCVCQKFGQAQLSPTTAHHVIHDRYGTTKSSDLQAIPLCDGHHQALWDKSKDCAIHDNKRKWRELYGADWSYSVQDTEI
ncbi:MAG: hypothetical protein CL498_03950 [Actinobacteria bacterium]|nr:hypothetical protein [Actinomycetota bacterium]